MFGRGRSEEIDAGAAIDRSEGERIAGERGASRLGSDRRAGIPGSRMFIFIAVVAIAALMAAFTWKAWSLRGAGEQKREVTVRQVIPSLGARPLPKEPAGPPPPAAVEIVEAAMTPQPPVRKTSAAPEKSLEERIRERMLKSKLSIGAGPGAAAAPAGEETLRTAALARGEKPGELAGKLEPLRLKGAAAGTLPDRDLFVTQGTMIDCVLDTRIVTDQPGMTVCYLTRDVYSASGRVVLLDRGSKVVGFYQGGLKQGQARIFIQWSRVETPEGVVIELASPGTARRGGRRRQDRHALLGAVRRRDPDQHRRRPRRVCLVDRRQR